MRCCSWQAEVQRWAAARGVPFRLQGYGTPPATVSSYRFADLPDFEALVTDTGVSAADAHRYGVLGPHVVRA